MKERLVELVKKAHDEQKYLTSDKSINAIADYLLENGVIVPPCKVGQTVYQVTRNFISEFKVRFIEISTCENVFLHTDLISGIILTGEVFPESEIGKTVFLTREEAEAKLKEGGKG